MDGAAYRATCRGSYRDLRDYLWEHGISFNSQQYARQNGQISYRIHIFQTIIEIHINEENRLSITYCGENKKLIEGFLKDRRNQCIKVFIACVVFIVGTIFTVSSALQFISKFTGG